MSETYRPRIAVLASGGGTTVEAFIHATQNNVNAEVGLVVCNNPPDKVGVYDRIKRLNDQYGLDIKTAYINGKMYPGGNQGRGQTLEESQAICDLIASGGYDHVALMGYMKEVRGALIDEYGWHPDFKSISTGLSGLTRCIKAWKLTCAWWKPDNPTMVCLSVRLPRRALPAILNAAFSVGSRKGDFARIFSTCFRISG